LRKRANRDIKKRPVRNYRIKISRAGSEFEVEGDRAFVLKMLARFDAATFGASDTRAPTESVVGDRKIGKSLLSKGKAVSIREFVQQLGFKKHTDITLAFGYYLEKQMATPEFTPADINNCYYEAKIESSNTSQMIILNIRRGFMMLHKTKGAKGRKRYTLTSSGEKHIEAKLTRGS
jgi:hypothetical protein